MQLQQRIAFADAELDVRMPDRPVVTAATWQVSEPADATAIANLAAHARSFGFRHYNQDIEWQSLAMTARDRMIALTDKDGSELQGFTSVRAHDSKIAFSVGGITLLRRRVRSFGIYEGIATRRPDSKGAIADSLIALSAHMPGSSAVFLEAVPFGSGLHAVLEAAGDALRETFYVLPWATTTVSRIKWPGSVDEYLKSIGRGTRKDLKRCATDLMADATAQCTMTRFAAPEDIDAFLRDGMAISDKTYQKNLLGRGLSSDGMEAKQIRFAAEKRAFLGHILYANGVPVAFQYGFIYNGTYFVDQVGYDPAWGNRQVGGVLFIESLRDLEKTKADIQTLDFGQGMTLFKERTTNERTEVGHYYLFRRTTGGFILYNTARAMTAVVGFLSQALERMKIRDTVKALLRRWTGHGHMR
jgi:Acetyltransferase (GNAT) domain